MIPFGGTYKSPVTIYDPTTNAPATSYVVNTAKLVVDGVESAATVALVKQSDGSSLAVGATLSDPRITATASVSGRAFGVAVTVRLNVTVGSYTQDIYLDFDTIGFSAAGGGSLDAYWQQAITGTVASSAAADRMVLAASASIDPTQYVGWWVVLTGGTGAGQIRQIRDYNGTTKVATVTTNWGTATGANTTYLLIPYAAVEVGLWRGGQPNFLANGRVPSDVQSVNNTTNAAAALQGLYASTVANFQAQAGTSTTITLASGAPAADNRYRDWKISLTGGTGSGQVRRVLSYNGATRVATVDKAWDAAPDATTFYYLIPATAQDLSSWLGSTPSTLINGRLSADVQAINQSNNAALLLGDFAGVGNRGTAQGGSGNTITVAGGASSAASRYRDWIVVTTGGAGNGQVRRVLSYDGTTKVATVDKPWDTVPSATTSYALFPFPAVDLSSWLGSTPAALDGSGNVPIAAGTKMDLVDAPNAMAIATIAGGVWGTLRAAATVANSLGKWIADFAGGNVTARATDGSGAALATAGAQASLLSAVNNLANLSSLANLFGPAQLEIPDGGSSAFPLVLVIRDGDGDLIDLDATPTLVVANAAGVSRAGNLSPVTHPSTGVYEFTYTVNASDAEEGLLLTATGVVGSKARRADAGLAIVNYDALATLNAVKAKADLIGTNAADSPNAVTAQASAAAAATDAATLKARVPSALTISGGKVAASIGAGDNADKDGYSLAAAYDRAKGAASPGEVSPTIAFSPMINPPGVTVSGGYTPDDRAAATLRGQAIATLAAKFAGITFVSEWLRAAFRKSSPDPTALEEINDGGGAFDPTSDSLEATADRPGGGTLAGPAFAGLRPPLDESRDFKLRFTQAAAVRQPIDAFDAFLAPLPLAGRTLRFVVFDANRTVLASINPPRLTIDGAEPNRCYVNVLPADVAASGTFRWILWDVTNPQAPEDLGRGPLTVAPAAIGA